MYHVGIHTVSTTITTFSLPRYDFTFFKEFHSIQSRKILMEMVETSEQVQLQIFMDNCFDRIPSTQRALRLIRKFER